MKIQIDTLAYTNKLRWMPPEHKLLFATVLVAISMLSHPLVQVLIALWVSVWIVIYAGIPAQTYLKLVCVATLFWLTSFPALVVNGVDFSQLNHVLNDSVAGFKLGSYYIYISQYGIDRGLSILARAIATLSCLYFILLTVPLTELLQILRRLGVPILITDLLLLMYRFIFILLDTANDLWIAQHSRGGYRNFPTGMKSLALLIGQLLKRTIDNYRQVSLSLAARGFNGELRFWHSHRYYQSKRYAMEAFLGCVILVGLEWWQNAGMVTRV
jgi:cobalt/nickel transport system permease protein